MDVLKLLTAEDVQTLFPTSAKENVNTGWPMVAAALRAGGLSEDPIVIAYVLATVRAETGNFSPREEGSSVASRGGTNRPFGAYDKVALNGDGSPKVRFTNGHLRLTVSSAGNRPYVTDTWLDPDVSGENRFRDLKGLPQRGVVEDDDGARFRGRGYVQLTGRGRYTEAAADTGLDLVNHPEIASQPAEAAQLLVWYIGKRRSRIRQHLAADTKNYLEARAVVNGKNSDGTVNGLAHFTDAYDAAAALVSAKIATAKASEAAKKASAGPASPAVSLGAKP